MLKTAQKKNNIILILCIATVIVLLSFFVVLFKDVIFNGFRYGRWFKLTSYEELLNENECEYFKEGDDLVLSCDSLIEGMSVDDNPENICYKIILIERKEKNLRSYTLCENSKKIFFTNPYYVLANNTLLPVKILFRNKEDKNLNYSLYKIEMTTLSDEELYEEWFKDENFVKNIQGTRKLLLSNAVYHSVSHSNDNYLFPDTVIGGIQLYNVKLEEVLRGGDYFILKFSGSFEGGSKPFNLLLKTRGFAYSDSISLKTKYITEKLIQETLVPNAYYEITLSYFTNKFTEDSKLIELCGTDDGLLLKRKSLCEELKDKQSFPEYNIKNIQDFINLVNNPSTNLENMVISDVVKLRDAESEKEPI